MTSAARRWHFHVTVPHVALFVFVWSKRVHMIVLNVWGRTPIFYRKELA